DGIRDFHVTGVQTCALPIYVDKLVKVHLRNGEPQLILVHLEVQHWPEGGFPARLYSYHTRLSEKGLPVVTVAILADSDPLWRPKIGRASCREREEGSIAEVS